MMDSSITGRFFVMKRKTAILLAAIMLAGVFLTGCTDKEEEEQRRAAEERARYSREAADPNRPSPIPNPDGTFG